MSEEDRSKHTLAGDGEPAQSQVRVIRQFALGLFKDETDGHLFFGMLPVIDGQVVQTKPYRFTRNNEETLEVFENFKAIIEGGKKRPVYLG